ncbi:hypothetical protein SERLA73DRAFT_192085 [Serpula lacrymans var. lacrymans S7.3]|uniref:Uncharacterized protein n=1 Tax=Serpula lacrymans var. lacrymans (strain S7.3) TaxID=936435 RepID=F8QIY7_SERL3|nr:hypothetical protein SERLA73DRAFT_192085 [Serpula lacrymans var. lacrymans S7.3]
MLIHYTFYLVCPAISSSRYNNWTTFPMHTSSVHQCSKTFGNTQSISCPTTAIYVDHSKCIVAYQRRCRPELVALGSYGDRSHRFRLSLEE